MLSSTCRQIGFRRVLFFCSLPLLCFCTGLGFALGQQNPNCSVNCDLQSCVGRIGNKGAEYVYYSTPPARILYTDTPQGAKVMPPIINNTVVDSTAGFWCPNPAAKQATKSDYCIPFGAPEPINTTSVCNNPGS